MITIEKKIKGKNITRKIKNTKKISKTSIFIRTGHCWSLQRQIEGIRDRQTTSESSASAPVAYHYISWITLTTYQEN